MNSTGTHRRGSHIGLPALAGLAILLTSGPVGAEPPTLAGDTVVVVVSASSSVTEISRLHLADLYMGRITRFPNGTPAAPVDQKAGSPARASFLDTYLDRSESQMKSYWSKLIFTGRGRPPREAASDQAVKELLARDPNAIGYIDPRVLDSRVRRVRVQ